MECEVRKNCNVYQANIRQNTRDGLRPIKRQKIGNANVRFVVLLGKFDFAGLNYLRKNQFDRMAIWCG